MCWSNSWLCMLIWLLGYAVDIVAVIDEDDEEMDVDAAKEAGDGLRELDMENFDEEDDVLVCLVILEHHILFSITPFQDEDSEDAEDMTINPTDVVLVCARSGEDVSQLEVWIYEEADDGDPNVYVHHDIIISANPLCTAWLDCSLKGNFIAVGSMEPSIEIWDLDILDEVQPCVVLGGIAERKEKKKRVVIKSKKDSHKGPVLGLAWNKEYRNILASASGDKRVKIWDVATGKCNITMEHHTDKGAVFSVSFSEDSPFLLAIGGSKGSLEVWDTLSDAGIQRRFGNYIKQKTPQPSLEDK
uniref:Uncharacterized protein n=1 Tax=Fagus sylvatica TaxID=28930 RepID=A0A2N9EWD9_FAGSY